MATPTYTALQTIELTGTASSVTFSSIPATYRDLVIVLQGSLGADNNILMQFNGDTGSNYSDVRMIGYGSSQYTSSAQSGTSMIIGPLDTTQGNVLVNVMDYSASDKHKAAIIRTNKTAEVGARAGRWADTSPVTAIKLFPTSTTFSSGFTVSLFGIEA
jgi:hypothetical protein